VTLSNIGSASLTISIISATGDFAQTNACTPTLAAGASCSINVTFTPAATGNRSGSLNVSTSGGSSTVSLSGTGANPVAGISSNSVAFGSELQGVTSTARTVTLTAGVNPLQISGIATTGDFSQSNTCGASLAPATSCSIQVTFAPASTSAENGTLTISSDEGVLSAQLSGSGITRAANTIYVPVDQPTIQAAINASVNGQTVTVLPGTYFEHIDFSGKAITLNTSDGPGFTTIDGSNNGTVVTFATGEGQASVLSGFTITHGLAAFNGSGILASSASPTIQNNVITANGGCDGMGIALISSTATVQNNTISNNVESGCTSGEGGGGILARGGTPQILNNVITGNTLLNGGFGGGISLNGSSANVVGNTIQHNAVFNDGGGISFFNSGSPNITQNLITDNKAIGNGGGIYWSVPSGSSGPIVVNNTIADNTATAGSAVFSDGFASNVQVSNNILVSQTATAAIDCSGTFSLIPPILSNNDAFSVGASGYAETCAADLGASGNISADPQFLDPVGGNFHLQPASPAIDAGNNSAPNIPALDLDGNPRIAFGNASTCSDTIDLGVYEFALNSTGVATLSPASFDFGIQPLNTSSAPATFTVNATQGCVSVKSASVSGDFAQSNNCSSILPTGGSCSVQVTFTPSAAGARSGVLSLNTDTTVLSSNLSGQGGVATASVAPGSLTFGNQLVGTTSAAQTVTLSNSGNLTLNISSITLSGDFAESNNCTVSLAPGASCTVLVTFTPAARLTRTGTLVIQSNSNSGTVSVSLAGTGIAPIASLTASLTFAPQVVGTTTVRTATLTNSGDAALHISSIVTNGDFVQTNNCTATLAPAASCSIQVSFTPVASGTRTGSLTVSDDALASPQQVTSLSGTGLDYAVSASPASVTVKQGGTANDTVSVSQLGGSFPNAVSLSCSGLPVGASCTFSPASVTPGTGTANSALSLVTSNGAHGTKKTPPGTYSISITGTSGTLSHKTTVTLVVN